MGDLYRHPVATTNLPRAVVNHLERNQTACNHGNKESAVRKSNNVILLELATPRTQLGKLSFYH